MALDSALIAFKKLFNKANTSPDKPLLPNETVPVGFTTTAENIFSSVVPGAPGTTVDYDIDGTGVVEKVTLVAEFIAGTDTVAGRHGFALKLPSDYETSSSNPKAGTFPFVNGQTLWQTTGSLQIVPSLFGTDYTATLQDTTVSTIPQLDAREWIPYEFGGVIYQETPPGTGADPGNPGFYECHIYIGDFVIDGVGGGGADTDWNENNGLDLSTTSSVVISGALSVKGHFSASKESRFADTLKAFGSIQGSHNYLTDGTTPAFIGVNGITVNFTPGSGVVEITGSADGTDTDWTETGTALYTTSSVNISSSLSVQNAITASVIANGAQYNGTQQLIASAGIVGIDASQGPNYYLVLSTSVTFDNPTNGVDGQELTIGIQQNSTGNFSTAFSSSWTQVGQLTNVALSASSDSVLTAVARDYGSGIVWDYAISHGETLTGLTDIDATTQTTNSTFKTISTVPTAGSNSVGLLDYSVVGVSQVSGTVAQFAVRSLYYKTGSTITPVDEDIYSQHRSSGASTWNITSSITSENINIRVQGGDGDIVEWKTKGIFKEHP